MHGWRWTVSYFCYDLISVSMECAVAESRKIQGIVAGMMPAVTSKSAATEKQGANKLTRGTVAKKSTKLVRNVAKRGVSTRSKKAK